MADDSPLVDEGDEEVKAASGTRSSLGLRRAQSSSTATGTEAVRFDVPAHFLDGSGARFGLGREHPDHDQPARAELPVELVQRRRGAAAQRAIGRHEEANEDDPPAQPGQGQRTALDPAMIAPLGGGASQDPLRAHERGDREESVGKRRHTIDCRRDSSALLRAPWRDARSTRSPPGSSSAARSRVR